MFSRSILVVFTTLLVCICSVAQNIEPGVIKGTIVEKKSKCPIGKSVVKLTSLGDSDLVRKTTSEEDGSFEIKELPAGKYSLQIWHAGYEEFRKKSVTIKEDEPMIIAVKIKTSPPVKLGRP